MKKYTKPIVVKVELNHEQAVLGTCSSKTTTEMQDSVPNLCLWVPPNKCKQSELSGDSAATS